MKTFALLSALGLVAAANAAIYENSTYVAPSGTGAVGADTTVTDYEVVATLTTYCPQPTVLTQGSKTYTVTKPTTLTITGKSSVQVWVV